MDLLAALILADDDTHLRDAGEGKLSLIILWIIVPMLLAGTVWIAKDVSMEWRVTNIPSISTAKEQQQVMLIREMHDLARTVGAIDATPSKP